MLEEIPYELAALDQVRDSKIRLLPFAGTRNFRDLGGYQTTDGRTIRWNVLYRSGALHKLTDADLHHLSALMLDRIIDFRAQHEKDQEPDRLPANAEIRVIGIPILDSSTQTWHDSRDEFVKNLKSIDPVLYMIRTNMELATRFTPEFKLFLHELLSASGRPVLFHCAAGKDRTGFAAAILLRILGVPQEVVMQDYLLTNQYFMSAFKWNLALARLLKGKQFAAVVQGFVEANARYLSAAFAALEREHISFESYVHNGLGLTEQDIERLKGLYLESLAHHTVRQVHSE
ncbi:MAG TPA: tyrosine-protein phosphatase [Anaerolineales bacterium]|nr:tyrosine-protein phosphatase [Anaerolineales bacterium]